MAEKSVIASISQAEERHFKTLQLPALRAVVSEPAQQKRRFFLLLYFQSAGSPPIQGRKPCFNDRHRLSSHSADKGCKLPLAGPRIPPCPYLPTQPLTGPNRGCFPPLRPSARGPRRKWVRASARIAGHPAAPSPTKSDRRSACPVQGAGHSSVTVSLRTRPAPSWPRPPA